MPSCKPNVSEGAPDQLCRGGTWSARHREGSRDAHVNERSTCLLLQQIEIGTSRSCRQCWEQLNAGECHGESWKAPPV